MELYKIAIACILSIISLKTFCTEFDVILESQWHDLENNEQRVQKFGGKWILAGIITFTKKAKDTVHLSKLYLQWHGTTIEQINASLYYHDEHHEKFIPLQHNLICDGLWNATRQTIMLNFDKKYTLGLTNRFYLVLTVPTPLESILNQGQFTLLSTFLPEPYQLATRDRILSLTFQSTVPKKSHTTLAANSARR